MAYTCGVSNNLFLIGNYSHQSQDCLLYSKILPTFNSRTLRKISNCPVICRSRFQFVHKSAPDKNSSTFSQSPPQESQASDSDTRTEFRERNDAQKSLFHAPFSRFRDEFKLGGLGMEIISIAMPAALALLADPIASLVDSAFVGHLGSVELAAVGVSVSVFNLVSKLFNVPLLNITTSFVAEEQASLTKGANESSPSVHEGKLLLPSVSTSLMLAAGLGIAEAIALSMGSGFLLNTMGITVVCLACNSILILKILFVFLSAFLVLHHR